MAGSYDAHRHAGEQLPDDAAVAQGVHRHFGRILAAGARYSPERIGLVRSPPRFTAWPGEQRRVRRPIHRRQPFREIGRDRDRIMRLRLSPFALSRRRHHQPRLRAVQQVADLEPHDLARPRSPPRARQTAQFPGCRCKLRRSGRGAVDYTLSPSWNLHLGYRSLNFDITGSECRHVPFLTRGTRSPSRPQTDLHPLTQPFAPTVGALWRLGIAARSRGGYGDNKAEMGYFRA